MLTMGEPALQLQHTSYYKSNQTFMPFGLYESTISVCRFWLIMENSLTFRCVNNHFPQLFPYLDVFSSLLKANRCSDNLSLFLIVTFGYSLFLPQFRKEINPRTISYWPWQTCLDTRVLSTLFQWNGKCNMAWIAIFLYAR